VAADEVVFKFHLIEGEEGGKAPAPRSAPLEYTPPVSKAAAALPLLIDEKTEKAPKHRRDDDGRSDAIWRYHEAQQAITGLSRGAYFASNFGMAGAVGAAGQFLEAGQSIGRLAGASEAGIDAIAGPAGVAVAALGAFALAINAASDATKEMAEKTARFGGAETATAAAGIRVERTMFELESAQRRDSMLGEFTTASGGLNIELDKLKRDLLDGLVPLLTDLARDTSEVVKLVRTVVEGVSEAIGEDGKKLIREAVRISTFPVLRLLAQLSRVTGLAEDRLEKDKHLNQKGGWFAFFNKPHFEVADVGIHLEAGAVVQQARGAPFDGALKP
jgi:hypothetical protein